jgi:CubicO group peptidase (beta-lactamase class C family)
MTARGRRAIIRLCVLGGVTLIAIGVVEPEPVMAQSGAVNSARALVRTLMLREQIPGLGVAVAVDHRIVWSEAFGYADLENRIPATAQTMFRIGSVSMPLTSVAVGLSMQRGRLNLAADVRSYVPSFPQKRYPFTVEQLAGHLAGIRHYQGDEFRSATRYRTVQDGLAIFARDTLLFEPGTRFAFSTYGWTLVSAVLESVTGTGFLDLMHQEVFEPLRLRHTGPDWPDTVMPNRAQFYEQADDGSIRVAPGVDNSYKWAGGGFVASPEDLARFGLALLPPGVLDSTITNRLWTSLRTQDGVETGYGIGWAVGRDADERRVVSHTGSSVGGRAILLIYPDERVVVAIATNLGGARFGDLPGKIAALFMAERE